MEPEPIFEFERIWEPFFCCTCHLQPSNKTFSLHWTLGDASHRRVKLSLLCACAAVPLCTCPSVWRGCSWGHGDELFLSASSPWVARLLLPLLCNSPCLRGQHLGSNEGCVGKGQAPSIPAPSAPLLTLLCWAELPGPLAEEAASKASSHCSSALGTARQHPFSPRQLLVSCLILSSGHTDGGKYGNRSRGMLLLQTKHCMFADGNKTRAHVPSAAVPSLYFCRWWPGQAASDCTYHPSCLKAFLSL